MVPVVVHLTIGAVSWSGTAFVGVGAAAGPNPAMSFSSMTISPIKSAFSVTLPSCRYW